MAAKFPSIPLVKYRRGDEDRDKGMENEGTRDGPGPRETSCRGCRGRMHRNYANCGSPPAEERHDGSKTPVVLSRWRRMASRRRGTRVRLRACRPVHGMFRGRARLPLFHSAAV